MYTTFIPFKPSLLTWHGQETIDIKSFFSVGSKASETSFVFSLLAKEMYCVEIRIQDQGPEMINIGSVYRIKDFLQVWA